MIRDPTKTKLELPKANAFTTALPIVNNNDTIYFYQKWQVIKPFPTIKSVMASFPSLCFSASILRLCGLATPTTSCQATGITVLGTSGLTTDNFL